MKDKFFLVIKCNWLFPKLALFHGGWGMGVCVCNTDYKELHYRSQKPYCNRRCIHIKNGDAIHVDCQMTIQMSDSYQKLTFYTKKEGGRCDSHQTETYQKWRYESYGNMLIWFISTTGQLNWFTSMIHIHIKARSFYYYCHLYPPYKTCPLSPFSIGPMGWGRLAIRCSNQYESCHYGSECPILIWIMSIWITYNT